MSFSDSLFRLLPESISSAIGSRLDRDRIYELRIRNGYPVVINYGGKHYYLTASGVGDSVTNAIYAADNLAGELLLRVSQFSLYAVNSQVCEGYLTISGGIRVGISGEVVAENDTVKTIKNVSSLNIRIPHEITGCAVKAFRAIKGDIIKNTLFISPPGAGKTTMLRDMARIISETRPVKNTLIIDERNEIAAVYNGKPQLNVGVNTDVISNCKKQYAFSKGIRSMSPDVIITDEIATKEDIEAIDYAINCGVSIIASTHASDHLELLNKPGFSEIAKKRLFSRYIVISNKFGPGTYDGIYNENFELLYSS